LYKFKNSLDAAVTVVYLLVKLTSLMCFYMFFSFFKGQLLVPLALLSCWTLVLTCYFILHVFVPLLVFACVLK